MKNTSITILLYTLLSTLIFADEKTKKEPHDLIQLRNNWEQAKQRAIKPLNRKYISTLKKLQTKYTKLGKLEEALAVKKEISSFSIKKENISIKEQVTAILISSKCAWTDGTPMDFKADGKVISQHDWLRHYKVREDGRIVIFLDKSKYWVLQLEKDKKSAKAINEKGSLNKPKVITIKSAKAQ